MARAGLSFVSPDLTPASRRDVVMTSTFDSSHDDGMDDMEPDLPTTAHMRYVDNRCACCPYGYHIDIDFLRYLESLGQSTDGSDLQQIRDNKQRLRETMEMYLRQHEMDGRAGGLDGRGGGLDGRGGGPGVDDDADLHRRLYYESSQTQSRLEREQQMSRGYDDNVDSSLFPRSSSNYKTEAAMSMSHPPGHDYDSSAGSVSIHSGPSSPPPSGELMLSRPGHMSGYAPPVQNGAHGMTQRTMTSQEMTSQQMTSRSLVTGGGVTDEVETFLVDGVVSPGQPGIPADMTLISSATLQTIREQMAACMRKMKELEEENETLRLLEARMSALKEDKRLLELQMKSKQAPITRSVGVGDFPVDDPVDKVPTVPTSKPRPRDGTDSPFDIETLKRMNELNKKPTRDFGVGDGNVFAVETTTTDVGPVRIHERDVSTEQNTEVKEKEIKTVFLSGKSKDAVGVFGGQVKPKQTRTIGVGDDKVFEETEPTTTPQVHQKELQRVYIGGPGGVGPVPKSTRNVGILCKSAMRDVGVMYHHDEAAPLTRNIAVGVNEMGMADVIEELGLTERSDTSVHVTSMALQQLNMAAFQSRSLRFSNQQVREVLDSMLKKNLRSVAVQCRFATIDCGVGTAASAADYVASVGCSDDTIDVDVVPVRQFRSVIIDCRPSVFHRACGADFVYRVDSATNTRTQGIKVDRGSNTDAVVKYPAATNTDGPMTETTSSETIETVSRDVSQTKKTDVPKSSSSPSSSADMTPARHAEDGRTSSELARQKKRDSMLFGDVDEPPLIVAGGEQYQPGRSDLALSTSSTSVGSGDGGVQLMMPVRTVSEPTFAQSTSTSSRESFICRSDEGLRRSDDRAGRSLEPSSVSDTSADTLSGKQSGTVTQSFSSRTSGGTSGQVYKTGRSLESSSEGDTSADTLLSGKQSGTMTQSFSSRTSGGTGGGRQVYVTETRIERCRTGPEVTGAITSEGSLRSIMKSSSSSDKDSSSPGVMRRKITFDDSAERRSDVGDAGAAASETDSQRSSASYEEGTYDGRQGVVMYSCKDDDEMMRSAAEDGATAVMYHERYQQQYVMSDEMSSACATYAQWLDDSTQVSAKDLNASIAVIQEDWFSVCGSKLATVIQLETLLTSVRDISQSLLEHVVNMTDNNGNSALHYAVSHGNFDVVSLLLDTGVVDVDLSNRAGYTAIMLASLADVQTDSERTVILRLFQTGNVNLQASQAGQTALMLAVSHGRLDLAQLLLDAGADVNVQDEDGSTALMCASEHGHVELVQLLLSQPNCDASITDNDGSTAMSIAMDAGHRDVGVMLYGHINVQSSTTRSKRKTVSTHTVLSMSRK